MSIQEQISNQVRYHAKETAALFQLEEEFRELGILNADYWPSFGTSRWENGKYTETPYVKLEPRHIKGIAFGFDDEGPTLRLVDASPTLGDAARILLPKVHKWDKSFDETQNKIRLTAKFMGVDVILEDAPPETCTVEKVEEEIEVPEKVVPAHTEKKVRYVLKGDCDPLLSARTEQVEPIAQEAAL